MHELSGWDYERHNEIDLVQWLGLGNDSLELWFSSLQDRTLVVHWTSPPSLMTAATVAFRPQKWKILIPPPETVTRHEEVQCRKERQWWKPEEEWMVHSPEKEWELRRILHAHGHDRVLFRREKAPQMVVLDSVNLVVV